MGRINDYLITFFRGGEEGALGILAYLFKHLLRYQWMHLLFASRRNQSIVCHREVLHDITLRGRGRLDLVNIIELRRVVASSIKPMSWTSVTAQ